MNLFFDEEAQKLIIESKKEMFNLKHPYVGSEHLFLAILKNVNLDVTKILNKYDINYDKFKKKLIETVGLGSTSNDWFLFTPLLKQILNNAMYYSKDKNKNVSPYCLLVSILQEGDGVANRILVSMNIDIKVLYDYFLNSNCLLITKSKNTLLDSMAINMNNYCLDGKYDPVIGRDEHVNRLIHILLRKNKCNPLLIGDAGVGKTAIVEELARRISFGDVPVKLKNKTIYSISMSVLISGTKYRGEFEERLNNLIKEVKNNLDVILFIDEIHTLVGAGGAEGAIDASNILKPYLARGDIKVIGATTLDEYSRYIEKDKALDRRFQKVFVNEPNKNEVKHILCNLKHIYEGFHNVIIDDNLIDLVINLSSNFFVHGKQPDKSIDLLDEICSYCSSINNKNDLKLREYEIKINEIEDKKNKEIVNHNFKKALIYKDKELKLRSDYNTLLFDSGKNEKVFVSEQDIYQVVYNRTKIPLNFILHNKIKYVKKLLLKKIYGQDEVIEKIISNIDNYDNINKKKPLSFLLIGKSGVGKTFLVEELSKLLFDDNYYKLNMGDFCEENSLSKIIGATPGYVGYNDYSILDVIKNRMFSVILLDNIDKANINIVNFFSDALNNGYITNSRNEKIDLSYTIIFITTSYLDGNVGFVTENSLECSLSSDFINSIMYKINFNDITRNTMYSYIYDKIGVKSVEDKSLKRKIDSIIDESNFEEFGFSKVGFLIEKYFSLDMVET